MPPPPLLEIDWLRPSLRREGSAWKKEDGKEVEEREIKKKDMMEGGGWAVDTGQVEFSREGGGGVALAMREGEE